MKLIIVLLVANLLAHSNWSKSYQSSKYNCRYGPNYHNYIDCDLRYHIIDSYVLNSQRIFVIKVNRFLSKFDKRVLMKNIRKHLGFHSKRVKFRFII